MNLLAVKNLSIHFKSKSKHSITAVKNASFNIKKGEILGLVGESGSGKSTLARAILQLQSYQQGQITWKGNDIRDVNQQEYRKQVQLIFQSPIDALNPSMTISQAISEPVKNLLNAESEKNSAQRVLEALKTVGLSEIHLNRYPHELSGGQCQRVNIARAMIVQPELLVCDEPVSALDVSMQAQIINLLVKLQQQQALSLLFISHDLNVVRYLCDRVMVIYKGEIVESGETQDLYENPQHEYTKHLLQRVVL